MNNCQQYEAGLLDAISKPEAAGPETAAHLRVCSACRQMTLEYQTIARAVRSIEPPDPGELFFHGQFQKIQKTIHEEVSPKGIQRHWWPVSLALAAAVILLLFGVSKWQRETRTPNLEVAMVELGLRAPPSHFLDFDELSSDQLDRLAIQMERQFLQEEFDAELPEASDWTELSGSELEQLLKRLQTQFPRKNHEA